MTAPLRRLLNGYKEGENSYHTLKRMMDSRTYPTPSDPNRKRHLTGGTKDKADSKQNSIFQAKNKDGEKINPVEPVDGTLNIASSETKTQGKGAGRDERVQGGGAGLDKMVQGVGTGRQHQVPHAGGSQGIFHSHQGNGGFQQTKTRGIGGKQNQAKDKGGDKKDIKDENPGNPKAKAKGSDASKDIGDDAHQTGTKAGV